VDEKKLSLQKRQRAPWPAVPEPCSIETDKWLNVKHFCNDVSIRVVFKLLKIISRIV
jgi:hypothetical protein